MLKTDLYNLVNYTCQDQNRPPISKDDFIVTLSSLELKGYVMSYGNNVEVIKEYKGGVL